MKKLLLLFTLVLSYCSCAPKIALQQAYLLERDIPEPPAENRVDIKTFYGGDAFDFITFQIDIDNRSSDTIALDARDITMYLESSNGYKTSLYPIDKNAFINTLSSDAHYLNREKKADTAANIILSGIGVLGAVLGGGNTAETVIYGTGTAVDIMDRRRGYEEAEMSIEEQIAYHEEYTLDRTTLAPGENASYDIHFSRLMTDGYCELEIFCADNNYLFEYDLEVIETRP